MTDPVDEVKLARASMIASRATADQAAAAYRSRVRSAVSQWRAEGSSIRKCAERLGITEGALRDLLRPEGQSRRAKKPTPIDGDAV